MLTAYHVCRHCNGSGYAPCPVCNGDRRGNGYMSDGKICYMCQGKAMVRCPACDGTGEVEDQKNSTTK